MRVEKWKRTVPVLILSLIFPVFVIGFGILFDIDTVDVTDNLVQSDVTEDMTVYTLFLPEQTSSALYNLVFEAKGNMVTINAGGKTLYEYGKTRAENNQMMGTVYVNLFLPELVDGETITIMLRPVDSNAVNTVEKVELCPHEQSTRYYLTNTTLGFPLALVLLSMAFCIPSFMSFGAGNLLIREGLAFGSILFCLSLLLLGDGGHFMLFSDNQELWNYISYMAMYLLPVLFLWFFATTENKKRNKKLLNVGIALNLAFVFSALVCEKVSRLHLCDFVMIYQGILVVNGVIAGFEIIDNLRKQYLTRIRRTVLTVTVGWIVIALAFELIPKKLSALIGLPRFDFLCIVAVVLFYVLCGFLVESSYTINKKWIEKDKEIEELKLIEAKALSTEAIAKAMSENYENVYIVDAINNEYLTYYESSAYGDLGLVSSGKDFFEETKRMVPEVVFAEDQEYVLSCLRKDMLEQGTSGDKKYSVIYRIAADGQTPVYYQLKAVKRVIDERTWFLIGVQNIDNAMQREKEHLDNIEKMRQKNVTHLEAILASAAGYIEVNLSKDVVTDISFRSAGESLMYAAMLQNNNQRFSLLVKWLFENIVAENKDDFYAFNQPDTLIGVYSSGEPRKVFTLAFFNENGEKRPCREVIYLYKDETNDDVLAFIVIYDLTEQQKNEREKEILEKELRMSRIRVFTGQMQPHFLYNALGSIQEIVLEDPQYASDLTGDFTTHLRGSIRAMSNDNPISFEKELENIVAYTHIEEMRFGKKLKLEYDIQATHFDILPLSIQPLVENAIRHGVYQRGPFGGTVKIASWEEEENYVVCVTDDGVGFDVEQLQHNVLSGNSDSTGLKNLVFRLEKLMNATVQIHSVIEKGTCITVYIPKKEGNNESNNS